MRPLLKHLAQEARSSVWPVFELPPSAPCCIDICGWIRAADAAKPISRFDEIFESRRAPDGDEVRAKRDTTPITVLFPGRNPAGGIAESSAGD